MVLSAPFLSQGGGSGTFPPTHGPGDPNFRGPLDSSGQNYPPPYGYPPPASSSGEYQYYPDSNGGGGAYHSSRGRGRGRGRYPKGILQYIFLVKQEFIFRYWLLHIVDIPWNF